MNKESHEFEKELEDFFQDRGKLRSVSVNDSSKKVIKENRCENDEIKFPEHPQPNMSGCCMTGCHDCPWGYKANL